MQYLILEKTVELPQYPINYISDSLDKLLHIDSKSIDHPAVYLYEHTNTFVSPFGLAFKNGKLLPESIYCLIGKSAKPYSFFKKILSGKVKKLEEPCVLFHHAWYDNYYHWFTECYPKLVLAKDFIKDKVLIMNESLKPFHKQSLEVIDCAGIFYCKENEIVKASRLYIIGQLSNHFGIHHPGVVSNLHAFLTKEFGIVDASPEINIYTSRARSTKRKCVNEKEVLALVKDYNFEVVITDDISLKEQFLLFSRTANVCGVHGSSFVNGLFIPPRGMIIDLIEQNHQDLCYYNLIKTRGVNYLYLPCDGVGDSRNFRDNDIIVNVPKLQKRLETYLYN